MQTETAKMIYPQQHVANMIAGRLTKVNGKPYTVYKVTTGFQVVPITKCESAMPPWPPKEVAEVVTTITAAKKIVKTALSGELIVLKFKFHADRPKTLHVIGANDGGVKWLHKSGMVSFEIDEAAGIATVTYPKKEAEKKGVIPWALEEGA